MNLAEDVAATGLTLTRGHGVHFTTPNVTPLTCFRARGRLRLSGWPFQVAPEDPHQHFPGVSTRSIYIVLEGMQLVDLENMQKVDMVSVVQQRLNGLLGLGQGWNGATSPEISVEAVASAASLALRILNDDISVSPQFFPLPNGGVQFEWHVGELSIEVEVDSDGSAFAVAEGSNGAPLIEEDVDDETPTKLHSFLREMVRQGS